DRKPDQPHHPAKGRQVLHRTLESFDMNIVQHVPTKPAEFPPNSFVLYGQPKIGKSDLFSKMPGVLFINLEDGLHHIAADITPPPGKPVKTIDELKTLIAEIAAGLANGSLKYRAVILDGL